MEIHHGREFITVKELWSVCCGSKSNRDRRGSSAISRVAIKRGSGNGTALSGRAQISAANLQVALSPGNCGQ